MIYDSRRIFLIFRKIQEESSKSWVVDDECSLWLNRDKRIVDSITGVQVRDIFFYMIEWCIISLHGQTSWN